MLGAKHLESTIKLLIELVKDKKYEKIRDILNNHLPKTEKGTLFELFLTELFKGNGANAKWVGKTNDKGGDIVLLDKSGEFVIKVIQAKNQRKPLSEDELAFEIMKFSRKGVEEYGCKFYSIYSVNGYTKAIEGYEEVNAEVNNWENIKTLIDGYQESNGAFDIVLLPHNEHTFQNIMRTWETEKRVCSVQATGTGKTYLIVKSILSQTGKKIVLAPLDKIHEQVKQKGAWQDNEVDYYTYNSISYKDEAELKGMQYDLIVLDEFHRAGAKEWGKAVQLLLANNPKAKVLGTTATPIRTDGTDMTEVLFGSKVAARISLPEAIVREILPEPNYVVALYEIDEVVQRMDEKIKIFDDKKRIKDKYKKEIESFKISWENARGMSSIFRKHITKESKFIVFCKDYQHLKKMKWTVLKWFEKAKIADNIDSYESTSKDKAKGDKQIKAFEKNNKENTIKLLFTINRLNEGLHIKSVDGVILLRSTKSHRIYLQQIGRAFDAGTDKKPIIFDLVNNFESLKEVNFVNDIQAAQKIHNEKRKKMKLEAKEAQFTFTDETKMILDFKEEMDKRINDPWYNFYEELVLFKEDEKHVWTSLMGKEHRRLKKWSSTQRYKYAQGVLILEKINLLQDLGFLFSEKEDEWYGVSREAKEHFKQNGTIIYGHPKFGKNSFSLHHWTRESRGQYEKNTLSTKQKNILKKLNFDFDGTEETWFNMFREAKTYHFVRNHLFLKHPNDSMKESLADWLVQQRANYFEGRLNEEKVEYLTSIHFILDEKEEAEALDKLLSRTKRVQDRVLQTGLDELPMGFNSPTELDGKENKEKNTYIEELPFNSLVSTEATSIPQNTYMEEWETNFSFIKQFYQEEKKNGKLEVNNSFAEDDANWLLQQRKDFTENILSSEQISLLRSIHWEVETERIEFETKTRLFKQNPNKEKQWGTYIHELHKTNAFKDWQKEIIFKNDLEESLNSLEMRELHDVEAKVVTVIANDTLKKRKNVLHSIKGLIKRIWKVA